MSLLSPRQAAYQFEEGTTFEYSIGDGESIGGSVKGIEVPVYIDWDPEDPTYYVITYDQRTPEEVMRELFQEDEGMQVNDGRKFLKYAYSIEEARYILNEIVK
ncbi:MAG: hypothetical protein ACO306_04920 [Flavobacteriaceae bacterium]